jgi:cytochrome c biogenesis protein CcdA
MPELTKEEIARKKKERAVARRLMIDRLRFWVGVFSVPSIMIMVAILVGSAYYLKSEALAVVTGLVSTVTLGLINVLQQMTAPPTPDDPVLQLAKENAHTQEILVKNLMDQQKSAEISMDKNHIKIGGNGMKIATSNDKDLVWGNDKPKKGKK